MSDELEPEEPWEDDPSQILLFEEPQQQDFTDELYDDLPW